MGSRLCRPRVPSARRRARPDCGPRARGSCRGRSRIARVRRGRFVARRRQIGIGLAPGDRRLVGLFAVQDGGDVGDGARRGHEGGRDRGGTVGRRGRLLLGGLRGRLADGEALLLAGDAGPHERRADGGAARRQVALAIAAAFPALHANLHLRLCGLAAGFHDLVVGGGGGGCGGGRCDSASAASAAPRKAARRRDDLRPSNMPHPRMPPHRPQILGFFGRRG